MITCADISHRIWIMSASSSVQLRLPTQEQIDKIIDFATKNKTAFSALAVMGYTTAKLVLGAVFGEKKEKQKVQPVKFDPNTDADSLVAGVSISQPFSFLLGKFPIFASAQFSNNEI